MTELITLPLYRRIEAQHSQAFPSTDYPNFVLGQERYAEHESIASTFDLAVEYLLEAREQANSPDRDISEKLIALYGQLAGYSSELVAHRDFDAIVILLALAKLEPNEDVERSLSCSMPVVYAAGESIRYFNSDEVTRSLAKSSASERISQIRNYYSLESGLQGKAMGHDDSLFYRLSQWPEEFHTYHYE